MKQITLTIALQFLCLLPIIGIAYWQTKKIDFKKIGLFGLLLLLSTLCLTMPHPAFMNGLNWNWFGKFVSIILGLAYLFFQKKETYPEYGFTTKLFPNSLKPVIIIFVVLAMLDCISYFFDGFQGYKVESLLFQATMPGLEEELWFRGIYLYLLNRPIS
jgi:uncharacterized protein